MIFLIILLIGFAGLTGYHIITCGTEINFRIEWNMFKSVLMWPLFIIGFLLGLGQKFNVYEPWIRKEYSDGSVEYEKDHDIVNNMEAGCVIPLLQYLVLGPIMIAAIIYYPLMALVYFFGIIFPYLIVAFLCFSIVLFHKLESMLMVKRSRLWSMPLVMSAFTGFIWLMYILWIPGHDVSVKWVNPVAFGVILAATISFVVAGIQAKKGNCPEVDAGFQPSTISKKFLITYIVSLLMVFGIYSFRVSSGYASYERNIPESAVSPDTPSGNLTDEQIRLSGRKAHGLLGEVKSVTYGSGEKLEFNADGNLISDGRKYSNAKRYVWNNDTYDILFPEKNVRYERWDSKTSEDIGFHYRFDEHGRIVEYKNIDYSTDMIEYTYAGTNDKLPSVAIFVTGDETGETRITCKYEYLQKDTAGNWIKRRVVKETKTVEYDDVGDTGKTKVEKTPSYTETAEYVYF
jgi:hypothetical protein